MSCYTESIEYNGVLGRNLKLCIGTGFGSTVGKLALALVQRETLVSEANGNALPRRCKRRRDVPPHLGPKVPRPLLNVLFGRESQCRSSTRRIPSVLRGADVLPEIQRLCYELNILRKTIGIICRYLTRYLIFCI